MEKHERLLEECVREPEQKHPDRFLAEVQKISVGDSKAAQQAKSRGQSRVD